MSFSLFCRKSVQSWMQRFWVKKCGRDHLRSLWRSVVSIRRWQRSQLLKEDGEFWPSVGLRRPWWSVVSMTVRRFYDGPSCRFVMKFREVIPVPRFQELKCFETKTLDGPLCLWRSVILAVEGNEEEKQKKFHKYGTTDSMTVCRDHDDPSRGPSTQPRFGRFPANRVLV